MRNYGANKATEFTKKQIGVIYRMAKNGELKVEKWVISDFYDLADYYGYDDNGSVEASERKIKKILDAVFEKTTKKPRNSSTTTQKRLSSFYRKKARKTPTERSCKRKEKKWRTELQE